MILVVLYDVAHGHFGGLTAAPVFSQIASGALRDLNVASTEPHYEAASLLPFAPATNDDAAGASTDALPGQALGGDDSTAAALIGRAGFRISADSASGAPSRSPPGAISTSRLKATAMSSRSSPRLVRQPAPAA